MNARILLSTIATALVGCGGFDRLEFTYKSAPPDNATVSSELIRMHTGIALGVTATPMDGGDRMDTETFVELDAVDPTIFGVNPGAPDPGAEPEDANWNFVFYGKRAGSTVLRVRIDGALEGDIQVIIDDQ